MFDAVAESARLVRALLRTLQAETRDETARVLETHISWVIVAGESAWKIKKPVDLGFCNFASLELRRQFCLEELRLNRRTAPDIYRDVVPIMGSVDAPRLAERGREPGRGPVLEYAVAMQRFPQEDLLSERLAEGRLSTDDMDRLADAVAGLHHDAAVAPLGSPLGTLDQVRADVQSSLDVLQSAHLPASLQAVVNRLADWTSAEAEHRAAQFAARKAEGFIREGHGDLHLGNIVMFQGRPVPFDCIEFNERFRWIDVLSDAAFTVMDLRDRGRPDLASAFLNSYLSCTGDYVGLPVFEYYLVYRALVRAKVAALRCAQTAADSPERSQRERELAEYLHLATREISPRPVWLAITYGLSGAGKSTGAQVLLEGCSAIRLRSDVERKRLAAQDFLAPLRGASPAGAGLYTAGWTQRTYSRLAELAAAVLRAGWPVIVDAACLHQADRDRFARLAAALGAPYWVLEFHAEQAELERRILARRREARDPSDADLDVLAMQMRTIEPLTNDERRRTLTVTSPQGLADRLAAGWNPAADAEFTSEQGSTPASSGAQSAMPRQRTLAGSPS